jgi:transcriptional regulator
MYLPAHFRVEDPALLTPVIRRHPLAVLITLADGVPTADHIPVELLEHDGRWQLLGHVAKANPMHRHVHDGSDVLAVFRAVDAYVSPQHYPSKAEHGKAVPTWNYEAVHVRGTLTWHRDPERLLSIVTRLTERHESTRAEPWAVSDAPRDYIDGMVAAIVGFTIDVTAMIGKFKASQNRSADDRDGLRRGLATDGRSAADIAVLGRDPLR